MAFKKQWSKKKESNLIPVAAFWDKESKAGDWYGSGSFDKEAFKGIDIDHFLNNLNAYSLKLFKVKEEYRKGDSSPTLRLYVNLKEDAGTAAPKKSFAPAKGPSAKAPGAPAAAVDDDGEDEGALPWER